MKIKNKKLWKKLTKVDEGEKKGFIFGGVSAFFIVATGLITIFIFYSSTPFHGQVANILAKPSFAIIASSWEESEAVQSLAYLCNLSNNNSYDKIECVYDFVIKNTYFESHGVENQLRQPEEIFINSTVCRDLAVFGKAVFNQMGFKNKLKIEPRHVYNIVYYDNFTCSADMTNNIFYCVD